MVGCRDATRNARIDFGVTVRRIAVLYPTFDARPSPVRAGDPVPPRRPTPSDPRDQVPGPRTSHSRSAPTSCRLRRRSPGGRNAGIKTSLCGMKRPPFPCSGRRTSSRGSRRCRPELRRSAVVALESGPAPELPRQLQDCHASVAIRRKPVRPLRRFDGAGAAGRPPIVRGPPRSSATPKRRVRAARRRRGGRARPRGDGCGQPATD